MKNVNAILLLGGLGKRLHPLTISTPKPLLPVKGKPLVVHQIELLKKHGIKEIVLSLGYKADLFRKFLRSGMDFGVKFHYSVESEPLGTAGALKMASRFVSGDIVVLNGDILSDFDITSVLKTHGHGVATIVTKSVPDVSRYGVVSINRDGFVKEFKEKPKIQDRKSHLINAGCYVLNEDFFVYVEKGVCLSLERDIFPKLINDGILIRTHLHKSSWIDIGTKEDYEKANK